jgi:hypothetical protein
MGLVPYAIRVVPSRYVRGGHAPVCEPCGWKGAVRSTAGEAWRVARRHAGTHSHRVSVRGRAA